MGIQNFPAILQPIIQQGFLDREFETALNSRLGYRLIADREEFSVGIGETLTKTRAGLKPSVTTPLAAASNTNLDNGLTSTNWGVEQYTITLNFYAATQDLNMVTSRVGIASQFAVLAPVISINALPSATAVNVALAVAGTVSPGNAAVRVGISSSSGAAPGNWVNATVSDGSWTASVTPNVSGAIYLWAQQAAATAVQAVSGALDVVTPALTVSAPGSGTTTAALTITGSVAPASDTVKVQLTTQNAAAPTSGWSAASNASGSFSAALTPAGAGTYYAWAEDPATGLNAVSAAIAVSAEAAASFTFNNPGGSYTHGSSSTVPLNGGVSPAQEVATQVALSTSNATPPSGGWQSATLLEGNTFWAIYYPVPAAAGAYYVWIETSSGGSQTVSSFTISVV